MWQNLHVNVEKVNFCASVNCIYRLEYLPEQAHKGAANKEERNQLYIFLNTKTKRTLSKLLCVWKKMVLTPSTESKSCNVLQLHALSFEIYIYIFFCTENILQFSRKENIISRQKTSYSFPLIKTMQRGLFSHFFEDLWSQNAFLQPS